MSDDHSQLGAAPATLFKCDNCGAKYPQRHNGWDTDRCIRCGRVTHQPAAAPAQPDARDAEIARLTKELEEARAALTEADEGENVALRARNAAEAQAKALREALKTARENLVHAAIQFASHYGEEDNTQRMRGAIAVLDHALAPTEPKAEAEPMVFCGAGEPGHDGEHRRTPRCWYPHKAGEPSPADWVNIPRAAPPPAETAGQKEGL